MKELLFTGLFVLLISFGSAQRDIAYLETEPVSPVLSTSMLVGSDFSFEMINGLIIITGELEGQPGVFILDTGAPGLVVNEAADPDPSLEARSIGGSVTVGQRLVEQVRWGDVEMNDVPGYTIDMTHLEVSVGQNLLGLLGFDLLDEYEIQFDYVAQRIRLYPLVNGQSLLHSRQKPMAAIPFRMEQHLPVIKLKIGRRKYDFGIDCGASINLIDHRFRKRLAREVEAECCLGYLRGLDGQGELSSIVTFRKVETADVTLAEAEFQWTAFEGLHENGLRIDGLVGSSFFGTDRISINYSDQMIYIWE